MIELLVLISSGTYIIYAIRLIYSVCFIVTKNYKRIQFYQEINQIKKKKTIN